MSTRSFESDVSKPRQNVLTRVLLTQSVVDELLLDLHMSCLFVTVHLYLIVITTGAAWVCHSNVSLWAQRENCFTLFMLKFSGLLRSPKQTRFCLFHTIQTALIKVTKNIPAAKHQKPCWVPILYEYSTVGTVVPYIISICDVSFLLPFQQFLLVSFVTSYPKTS